MSRPAPEPLVYLGLQALQAPLWTRHRGFARYVRDHTLQLLSHHRELIGGLVLDRQLSAPKELADFVGYDLLREYSSATPQPSDPDGRPVIFHAMSPTFPWGPIQTVFPAAFLRSGAPLVVTLYDLIPLIYPQFYLTHPLVDAFYRSRYRLVEQADHVLAISQCTKEDGVRLLGLNPERITVIYGAVSDYFCPPELPVEAVRRDVMRKLPQITDPYVLSILFTDEFGKRKNLEGVIAAFAQLSRDLRDSFQLVLVGHGFESDYIKYADYARKWGVADRIVFPGLVPDDLFRELYQACALFVFPSVYEGLGLPIIEAMRCGAPVIASDRTSMKELVQIEEARFDPEDPADISRVMERSLTDAPFQRRLREYGLEQGQQFNWEHVAQLTADCYRQIGASMARDSTPPRRSRSVAFCLPFPPDRSEVAGYGKRLVETLCQRHPLRVDVVVKGSPDSYLVPGHPAVNLISARQFRWLADHGHYDAIIYFMANDSSYGYIYELLKERRGIVWLHDVRLTGFYNSYYRRLGWDPSTLPPELLPWAYRYPDPEGDLLVRDLVAQHEQGIYLAGEVASCAQKVVVGSSFSKELLELESGAAEAVVIPYGAFSGNGVSSGARWRDLASRYGIDRRAAPIVHLGPVGSSRCPEAIIDAFAAAGPDGRNLVLAFVGECPPSYQAELERRAQAQGVGDRVLFTGYVDEAEVDRWLAVARCALQLRFPTDGGSSGSVMRCLAAGVPTIVSDHGPLRELPDDAVVKVPPQVEPARLARTVCWILDDDGARARLRRGARRYAKVVSVEAVADRFWSEVICAP